MEKRIVEKELSYTLGGIFFKVQDELGRFCRERQYADALEKKLREHDIAFHREYVLPVAERASNIADFVVADKVVIDVKAKPFITKDDYYQMRRYLNSANLELGLIVNFRARYLKPHRVLNGAAQKFVDSDTFVGLDRSRAFTLVELMISLGLFSVALAIAAVVFSRGIVHQRTLTELVNVSNRPSTVFEQMAREIRTGADFCATLGAPCGASALSFVNAKGEEVVYELEETVVMRSVNNDRRPILGEDEQVTSLRFAFRGIDPADFIQPLITFSLSAGSRKAELQGMEVKLQTSISPRI